MKYTGISIVAIVAVASASVAAAGPSGDPAAGKASFAQCAGCHSLAPGQTRLGPSLAVLIGRPVASVPGYAYSQALQSGHGQKWTTELLQTYLANPNAMFPGNKMGINVANAKTRADIATYLATNPGA